MWYDFCLLSTNDLNSHCIVLSMNVYQNCFFFDIAKCAAEMKTDDLIFNETERKLMTGSMF